MDQDSTGLDPDSRHEPLCDEQGPIPTFPPLKLDERGRIIPESPEERQARSDAIRRTLKAFPDLPDEDPPGSDEEFMRAMDSHRAPGFKLFEQYYGSGIDQGSSDIDQVTIAADQVAIPSRPDYDREPLIDEQGPIPDYPPRRYDDQGRPLPFTPEEVALRSEIFRRSMALIDATDQDPPGSNEEFMRGIDSRRPEGMKLFEGYY